ncbi:hypothetical protein O3P69_018171 [Scylla paramamosain]|uniref:Uncharacterized protein n=1 Tax=Scylla paramamosain TaxID=85552 RepID=A0AAW0TI54_SCYPA
MLWLLGQAGHPVPRLLGLVWRLGEAGHLVPRLLGLVCPGRFRTKKELTISVPRKTAEFQLSPKVSNRRGVVLYTIVQLCTDQEPREADTSPPASHPVYKTVRGIVSDVVFVMREVSQYSIIPWGVLAGEHNGSDSCVWAYACLLWLR